MNDNIDIVIIRGAPGSGKSQTAKSLTRFFPKGVRLEVDAIRQMVVSVDWTNQQEHINMLEASTILVSEFIKFNHSPVIVIDTFSGDKLNAYLDSLYKIDAGFSIKVFGLHTSNEELKKRLESRKDNEFRDYVICKKLNEDVLKFKYCDEFQIDTTGLLPEETSEKIYRKIIG